MKKENPIRKKHLSFLFRCLIYGIVLVFTMGLAFMPSDTMKMLLPKPSIHVAELKGNAKERGLAHGKTLKWKIRLLEKLYMENLAPPEAESNYKKQAADFFGNINSEWLDELKGIADASGASLGNLLLGNAFYDLNLRAMACRQVHVNTPSGLLHSHNLDWDNLGGAGNYCVTIFRSSGKPGAYRTVHVGFPGMAGALDIVNEHGVALSFNQLGRGQEQKPQVPIFIFGS